MLLKCVCVCVSRELTTVIQGMGKSYGRGKGVMRKNQGTKIDPRCKRCGELKKSDPLAQGKHRRNVSNITAQYCTVAKQDYELG